VLRDSSSSTSLLESLVERLRAVFRSFWKNKHALVSHVIESETMSELVWDVESWDRGNIEETIVDGWVSSPVELLGTSTNNGGVRYDIKFGTLARSGLSSDRVNFDGPVDALCTVFSVVDVGVQLDLHLNSI